MTTAEKNWYKMCLGRLAIRKMIKNNQLNEKALLDDELALKLGEYVKEVK